MLKIYILHDANCEILKVLAVRGRICGFWSWSPDFDKRLHSLSHQEKHWSEREFFCLDLNLTRLLNLTCQDQRIKPHKQKLTEANSNRIIENLSKIATELNHVIIADLRIRLDLLTFSLAVLHFRVSAGTEHEWQKPFSLGSVKSRKQPTVKRGQRGSLTAKHTSRIWCLKVAAARCQHHTVFAFGLLSCCELSAKKSTMQSADLLSDASFSFERCICVYYQFYFWRENLKTMNLAPKST